MTALDTAALDALPAGATVTGPDGVVWTARTRIWWCEPQGHAESYELTAEYGPVTPTGPETTAGVGSTPDPTPTGTVAVFLAWADQHPDVTWTLYRAPRWVTVTFTFTEQQETERVVAAIPWELGGKLQSSSSRLDAVAHGRAWGLHFVTVICDLPSAGWAW